MKARQGEAREPKPFPRYDEVEHIDSAAVAPLPPYPQSMARRGDPEEDKSTARNAEK